MLFDAAVELSLNTLSLRYFNVIGNDSFSEAHDRAPESIVPATFRRLAAGEAPVILGQEYPTADGTCVRDYIDVRDLADAHVMGVMGLMNGRISGAVALNLASGRPASVLEVVDCASSFVEGAKPPVFVPGAEGDPAVVWGSAEVAMKVLGWGPQRSLEDSVSSYWASYRASRDAESVESSRRA